MKLEVKNIKHVPRLSEETNAFSADLYVDGEKIANCSNRGKGGNNQITAIYSENEKKRKHYREQLAKAEAFAKTLPGVKSDFKKDGLLPMDLEFFIDLEIEKDLFKKDIQKFIKKLDKLTEKNIVVISKSKLEKYKAGELRELNYRLFGNGKNPIAMYPKENLVRSLNAIKLKFIGDEEFYNKNIPV